MQTELQKHNKPGLPGFKIKQYEFAAHIRDPENNPPPSKIEARRMAIYSELFYNNVESFVSGAFPVLRELYEESQWHEMVRDFFSRHKSKTPLFLEISQEFLIYLQTERNLENDPAFILELAHYEWIELAASIAEPEIEFDKIDTEGDFLGGLPVLSPLAWPLNYQYPVHKISPDFQPENPEATPVCLIVYRDRNDEVGFMETNSVTNRLLQLIQEFPDCTGRQHLQKIVEEMQHPNPDIVIKGGLEIMENLRKMDILPGIRIS